MPLWFLPALVGLCGFASLGAMIWLLLHFQSVAVMFRRKGFVPAPTAPKVSRRSIWIALAIFILGWAILLAILLFDISGEANEAIEQEAIH